MRGLLLHFLVANSVGNACFRYYERFNVTVWELQEPTAAVGLPEQHLLALTSLIEILWKLFPRKHKVKYKYILLLIC